MRVAPVERHDCLGLVAPGPRAVGLEQRVAHVEGQEVLGGVAQVRDQGPAGFDDDFWGVS